MVHTMREKKEINIQIGERIKIARERVKLTQEQLAEYVDVSSQYISDAERGVVGVSLSTLKKICIVLQVSSDELLFGNENEDELSGIRNVYNELSKAQIEILNGIIHGFAKAIKLEQEKA